MPLTVFISYASEDRAMALDCYERLAKESMSPWMDAKQILPGQNWEAEIERALKAANVVVLLLSKHSVSKRGFVQREANEAIEQLRYKQPTDIYVIPLLLEECAVPEHISARLQYVSLNNPGAWEQVFASLKLAAVQQSLELSTGQSAGPFKIFTESLREEWAGSPGYDVKIEFPRFESASHQQIASELSSVFRGRAVTALINERQTPWAQSPDLFADRQGFTATNGRWEGFGLVNATSQLLSLTYDVGWYGAGAAHPNSHFETHTYQYEDKLFRLVLNDFFRDTPAALQKISEICVNELAKEYWHRAGEKPGQSQMEWFQRGAGPALNNFAAFTVSTDHFTFLFAPYQVSSYAMGQWSVNISFYDLLDVLRPNGPHEYAKD